MEKHLLIKNGLVFAVILLFFSVAIAPSVYASEDEILYLSNNDPHISFDFGLIWGKYTEFEKDPMGGGSYYCNEGELKAFILLGEQFFTVYNDFVKVNTIFLGYDKENQIVGIIFAGALVRNP